MKFNRVVLNKEDFKKYINHVRLPLNFAEVTILL